MLGHLSVRPLGGNMQEMKVKLFKLNFGIFTIQILKVQTHSLTHWLLALFGTGSKIRP